VRVTTVFKRLVRLEGVNVSSVVFAINVITVTVVLRRQRLSCPHCPFSTWARYDTRPRRSVWRHLDMRVWRVRVHAQLRRLRCPVHGVVAEAVPFARPGAHLTRDFDDLVAWLATRTDKTAISRLCRVSWRTVGRACERVVATELDPGRLDGLFRIGVDEISWRKHHKYLTLVVDHDRGKVIWGPKEKTPARSTGSSMSSDPNVPGSSRPSRWISDPRSSSPSPPRATPPRQWCAPMCPTS
jgi:transposase